MTKDEKISKIIEFTIKKFEGGFVNHKHDKGGPTNFGITQKVYNNYYRKKTSINDIKNMKIEEAIEIYKSIYFKGYSIDTKFPEELWHFMFDCYVNHSSKAVGRIIQRSLNDLGCKLMVDGVIGKQTLSKIPCYSTKNLLKYMIKWRIWLYNTIVKNDHSQEIFLEGWLNRANWFKDNKLW